MSYWIFDMIRNKTVRLIVFMCCSLCAWPLSARTFYVSPAGIGGGTSWSDAVSLETALQQAVAGDQIWVQGFEIITHVNQVYVAPSDGFTVKSGVQLYGGFKGDETDISQRETLGKPYQLKHRSVLSGDINKNDSVDNVNLIFPGNTTRSDNATHVVNINMDPQSGGNNNTYPTVINGFSIGGGHADGVNEKGGGVYVSGNNTGGGIFRIERCFFFNNYAVQGGAIYVDANVRNRNNNLSLVSQCVVFNNASGARSGQENSGGGIYLAGEGDIVNSSIFNNENGGVRLSGGAKVVNSTVARNTNGGIDMIASVESYNVYNTIVWGNSSLFAQFQPKFKNSAFHEVQTGDGDGNIYVTKENRGNTNAPMFDAPSLKTSYDRDFNWYQTAYPLWSWNVLEGSVMHGKGDLLFYNQAVYGNEDMAGNSRMNGSTIDIGAYEFQQMQSGRIRYVKPKATGTGDGTSWDNASSDLQKMIDELAGNNPQNLPGEVWVAAGTYVPQVQIIAGTTYSASFLMRDGISVYGGFAGTESSKQARAVGAMPWNFTHETILEGSYYDSDKTLWNEASNKWTLTADSRHVVFFAPLPSEGKSGFERTTTLNGVTVRGGYAQGSTGISEFLTDRGAGVYMGINAVLEKCIVKENSATGNGGGVYLYGGRVLNSLIYNNNADGDGGAVYVDNAGIVLASMLANNSADNGAGVYLAHTGNWTDGKLHPEYLILSTSIVSNNTSRRNGAVYCANGGVLLQNTITNNYCPTATDNTSGSASRTGGLYVDSYALVVNSVLWNNTIQQLNVPMYAKNPTTAKVRFFYTALSGINNSVWNNVLQKEIIPLAESNDIAEEGVLSPDFEPSGMPTSTGVNASWRDITYFWQPVKGANLRALGMTLGTLPEDVIVAPEIDVTGKGFAQKPAVGAYAVENFGILPEDTGDALKVYVDVDCTVADHNGSSWNKAYRSLNEAIAYLATLDAATVGSRRLEVHVLEGDLWPRYAFTNLDPKTATIDIPATASGATLYIYGGYHLLEDNATAVRSPLSYRSVINGNHEGKDLKEGLYHCITVAKGAKVTLDGFHVINGYAAGEATRQYGAGLLVHDGAEVTVNNCIFENHTAQEGAAIDARNATLTLNNCVVNNNTNITETASVINCPNLTMNHVTVVNNLGTAPAVLGTSSFSAGNTSGNTFNYASFGMEGSKNFSNPTNKQGATLGFDTYLGGYSNFAPLTSSTDAGNLINKATGTPAGLVTDIVGNSRSLGGSTDMGAYEANLPVNGTVFYVTAAGAGKKDGSSWENAIAGNLIYDVTKNSIVSGDISTTDSRYVGFYDATSRPYGETSGASKLFFEHLNESNLNSSNVNYNTATHAGVTHVTGASGINIRNNRQEQYVGGLQYAVERAAALASLDSKQRTVWVAGGTYTDYKGFVIRDKVDVLGGFPNEGTPGENDRHPLMSQYIPENASDEGLDKSKYETIIQIQAEPPWTYNNNNTPTANPSANLPERTRKPVLFQPDVCLPTMSPSGRESSFSYWEWGRSWDNWSNHWIDHGYGSSVSGANEDNSNKYRWEEQSGGYIEYTGASWDGFTIRHGFYTDYKANRDGGAGVRMFRGVTLQNCVVTDNYINNHNNAARGAGIYCDGNNSKVINCFVLNNANTSDESYGGGMYMILGTSYNTLVANNYAKSQGGGIFIEDAMFYNNTVAYNRSEGSGGLHQWTASSGTTTTLLLYNTIFYGNSNRAIGVENVNNFNGAWNCYVSTATGLDSNVQNKIHDSQIGQNLANPFESADAQIENNYRLNGTTWCLNNGAETLGNGYDGKPVVLPYTDVDFTDRIKDCTVDIGAYERSNQDNVKPDNNGCYYVTQNGAGAADASSLANAACAMKLQEVLYAAGERAKTEQTAIVKIAGYEGAPFVYHANTLSNANDPQSYTYVIPYGVTVMGGYSDQNPDWDDDNDGYKRNPWLYKTVLSAINNSATLEQEVNGYHTVTFGEKPENWTRAERKSIIDGLYLIDGKATSLAGAGNPNTQGGGAIVPAWAHVRNCVVARCEAVQGGGLYVMPGGTVSGSLIIENKAEEGAGLYADNTHVGAGNRAHVVSCTITDNVASSMGGGLFMQEGAVMVTNSVLWGNSASSDKNISGVLTEALPDDVWAQVATDASGITEFYPMNHSFVETYEMPSNFENTSMESNEEIYFTSSSRLLKAYSPLIKHGMEIGYQEAMVNQLGIAPLDMQGLPRIQEDMNRVDAGAYAFNGGTIPTDVLLTRIFVSQGANVQLPEGANMDDYIGRSFYTSLAWLDDALEYIRTIRSKNKEYENTKFEIMLAAGTYKPSYRRTDAVTQVIDQRRNSYVIPQGVSIYGGFSGDEKYSSGGITQIPGLDGVSFTDMAPINDILSARIYSDFNQNGIEEPWELAHQAILSGNVNVSEQVKNVYHVVYSNAGDNPTTLHPVVLDGLTVMDGETSNVLSDVTKTDEIGRGGGIYSNGVPYVLNRCRLTNNFAVRGGAVYMRDAKLTIINSILAGNGTVENPQPEVTTQLPRGGAVYVAGVSGTPLMHAGLYAINTLWVNNETAGQGGAIGTNYADGILTAYVPEVSLMNNTLALNKAQSNAVIYHHNGKNTITNTLMWGNEAVGENIPQTDESNTVITYSASETIDLTKYSDTNIKLSDDNTGVLGPRFAKPTSEAGVSGFDLNAQWNPAAISALTDAGNGKETADGMTVTGAYNDWWGVELADYSGQYMENSDGSTYRRYAGPLKEDGTPDDKPIDIGVYEYQYKLAFSDMDSIYVATEESGKADGTNWANATSDLRGALVAMANPTGGNSKNKKVFVKAGDYSLPRLSSGVAYVVSMGNTQYGESLEIKGSYNESGVQDFSHPTIITTQENNQNETTLLMEVDANDKRVSIDGLTFINKNSADGTGLRVSSTDKGKVMLKNVGFRGNRTDGLKITESTGGEYLLVNVLFADGGTGLSGANDRTTVVNATFVNNDKDLLGTAKGIYNTVSWNNVVQNLSSDMTVNMNVAIESGVDNDDVNNGPNFRDPDNADIYSRDYRIRPSVRLLNKGSNANYLGQAGVTTFDNEKDFAGKARLVDNTIDIGAYEYEAELQPIVYVKADLTGTADGKSWNTALGDLQGATDLAGLYVLSHSTENAYVFVHGNYQGSTPLNITLGGVKVYGSMNDEMSDQTGTEEIVADLLSKRKGVLETTNRSTLQHVNLLADGVIDGFEIHGTATVGRGVLATSIMKHAVEGTADGTFYNSLAEADVRGVKAVNVTAVGTIEEVPGSGNNRALVTETNGYVLDSLWRYQLSETSADLDPADVRIDIADYMAKVGHSRDLIGNQRVRNTVDNGCFETWNVTADSQITSQDKPIGKSVVYVRKGHELSIMPDLYVVGNAFKPGFLLLEHGAGLRGNGNDIALDEFAVERILDAGGHDLAAMPFAVDSLKVNKEMPEAATFSLYRYDGAKRASYTYRFKSAGDNDTWVSPNVNRQNPTEGWLLESNPGDTVRFYGNGYAENGQSKAIRLMKYNYREPWNVDTGSGMGGNRFTHTENMGWNLFGSPFLCAMNYEDLEYGRVIYRYDADGNYTPVYTWNRETELPQPGHIAAGSAVFTQTATLRDEEYVPVSVRTRDISDESFYSGNLAIAFGRKDEADTDLIQLTAVPTAAANSSYDVAGDGVKMSGFDNDSPSIYMLRDGGRYSLLSAVDVEGYVNVGVSAASAGLFEFRIPADCDTYDYETVLLRDALLNRMVDLKETSYVIELSGAGEVNNRFSVVFTKYDDNEIDRTLSVFVPGNGLLVVSGMSAGSTIRLYDASGLLIDQRVTSAAEERFRLRPDEIYIVELYNEDSGKTEAMKVVVR